MLGSCRKGHIWVVNSQGRIGRIRFGNYSILGNFLPFFLLFGRVLNVKPIIFLFFWSRKWLVLFFLDDFFDFIILCFLDLNCFILLNFNSSLNCAWSWLNFIVLNFDEIRFFFVLLVNELGRILECCMSFEENGFGDHNNLSFIIKRIKIVFIWFLS